MILIGQLANTFEMTVRAPSHPTRKPANQLQSIRFLDHMVGYSSVGPLLERVFMQNLVGNYTI